MKIRLVWYVVLIVVCGTGIGYISTRIQSSCADFTQGRLVTPSTTLSIALAETPEEQATGLGGCRSIPQNSGMYFLMQPAQTAVFWMKDMLIPIDIVWIRNGEVIGIEDSVPNESAGTLEGDLKRYPSPGEVDGVLEIKAGTSKEYGIEKGTAIRLD
jgi:uncharacterized membrane protein (UPF0127 family)